MPDTAVCLHLLKLVYILADNLAKLPLYFEMLIDVGLNFSDLVLREVFRPFRRINVRRFEYLNSQKTPDAEKIRQGNINALRIRNIYANDSHIIIPAVVCVSSCYR